MGKTRIAGELVNNIFINQSGTTSFTGSLRVSGSSNIIGSLNATSLTGSLSYTNLTSLPTLVSGSEQVASILTSLNTATSSYETKGRGIISSSAQLENATITNLTITNLTTVNETASVIFSSGSNRFGDFGDDIHSFTGSVKISGSIATIGSSTATSFNGSISATNGVVSGSSQVDAMSTTNIARLATTGSNTFRGLIKTTQAGQSISIDAASTSSVRIQLQNTSGNAGVAVESSTGGDQFTGTSAYSMVIGTYTAKDFHIGTNSVTNVTVKSGGNVLINTTSDNGAKLQVNGRMRANSYTSYGGDVSIASGATATIYTMNDNGLYTAQCFVYGGSAIYMAAATFISLEANTQYFKCIDLYDGANVTLDNSGSSIRITNNGFATLTWSWSVLFQGY